MWKIFVPFSVVGNEGEKESMRGKGKALLKKALPPRPHPHLQNFLIGGMGARIRMAACFGTLPRGLHAGGDRQGCCTHRRTMCFPRGDAFCNGQKKTRPSCRSTEGIAYVVAARRSHDRGHDGILRRGEGLAILPKEHGAALLPVPARVLRRIVESRARRRGRHRQNRGHAGMPGTSGAGQTRQPRRHDREPEKVGGAEENRAGRDRSCNAGVIRAKPGERRKAGAIRAESRSESGGGSGLVPAGSGAEPLVLRLVPFLSS